jgi:hypothetical protein
MVAMAITEKARPNGESIGPSRWTDSGVRSGAWSEDTTECLFGFT